MKMIDEFYKETAYKLNEDKTDFIAFAQHHGIPTNLLDISASPLTALYFACERDFDDEGMVHVTTPACIDITELIHSYPSENIMTYIEPVYNFRVLAVQHLYFQEQSFLIKNKSAILQELDKIGINRKTLFCDYDNIAKYITEKYSVLKEETKLN